MADIPDIEDIPVMEVEADPDAAPTALLAAPATPPVALEKALPPMPVAAAEGAAENSLKLARSIN